MPLYTYLCTLCGELYDLMSKAPRRKRCSVCKAPATAQERQLSAPNFIVHGYNARNSYGLKR